MKIVNRLPLSKLEKGFIATYIRVTVLVVPLAAIMFVSVAFLFEHFTMAHAVWGIIISAFIWMALIWTGRIAHVIATPSRQAQSMDSRKR